MSGRSDGFLLYLRRECVRQGLPTYGSVEDLRERLRRHAAVMEAAALEAHQDGAS